MQVSVETATTEKPGKLNIHGYIPGLDVLRGLAVASVVFFHGFANAGYVAGASTASWKFVQLAQLGKLGVYLFFTLSGFLISSILLKQRERDHYYKNFYIRRALRILPAYLLMLIVLRVLGVVDWRFVLACLLFIANMAKLIHSHANEYGVLWTLAVEEQFYLIWPTVVRHLRDPRSLLKVIVSGCVLAVILRFVLTLAGTSTYLLLPTNMDALLLGAACAALISLGTIHPGNIRKITRVLLGTGFLFLIPFVYLYCFGSFNNHVVLAFADAFLRYDPYCFFVAGVLLSVDRAQRTAAARPGAAFIFLSFLGYISYGLYLVHPLLFDSYDHLLRGTALGGTRGSFSLLTLRFVLMGGLSILIATLSRRYYEQLFLGRKKQLAPYAGAAAETESLP